MAPARGSRRTPTRRTRRDAGRGAIDAVARLSRGRRRRARSRRPARPGRAATRRATTRRARAGLESIRRADAAVEAARETAARAPPSARALAPRRERYAAAADALAAETRARVADDFAPLVGASLARVFSGTTTATPSRFRASREPRTTRTTRGRRMYRPRRTRGKSFWRASGGATTASSSNTRTLSPRLVPPPRASPSLHRLATPPAETSAPLATWSNDF